MGILKINLQNCYGIRKLEHSFDLGKHEGKGGSFSIYAPNGVMKSSLARTFEDYANGNDSKDLIFPTRETSREIKWDQEDLDPNAVFVIKPYVESYESEAISTLIANPALQREYSTSVKSLMAIRKKLSAELKSLSGISSRSVPVEKVLASDLGATDEDLPDKITNFLDNKYDIGHLTDVKYSEVFNPKTLAVLNKSDFQSQLEEYVELYNKLVDESPVLCRTFNHQGASTVSKGLKETGFYTAGHSVTLMVGNDTKVIKTAEELEETFLKERQKILSNEGLQKRFEEVDKSLGNAETKKLRSLIESNEDLLIDLSDPENLKKKLWYSYFQKCKDELDEFLKASLDTKLIFG